MSPSVFVEATTTATLVFPLSLELTMDVSSAPQRRRVVLVCPIEVLRERYQKAVCSPKTRSTAARAMTPLTIVRGFVLE